MIVRRRSGQSGRRGGMEGMRQTARQSVVERESNWNYVGKGHGEMTRR